MHNALMPPDQLSSWLIVLAFLVVLWIGSRAVEKLTGRTSKPPQGWQRFAYFALPLVGALGTIAWIERMLHRTSNPLLVGVLCGVWALLAQVCFGRRTER